MLEQVLLEVLSAARDDEVDVLALLEQLGELPAVRAEVRDGLARQAGLDDRALDDLGEDAVGVQRRAAAAQDDGVAGLEAERGRVDGHVGPRLVDDGDDAQRHADLAQLHAVVEAPAVDELADGVRQGRDVAHGALHVAQAVLVEQQAVDERVGEAVLARQTHVLVVLGQDLGGAARAAPRRRRTGPRPCAHGRAPRARAKPVAPRRTSARPSSCLLADQHQAVPVHDFVLEVRAHRPQLVAAQSADAAQVAGAHRREPPGDFAALGAHDRHGVTGRERPVNRRDTYRKQAAPPLRQGPCGPGVHFKRTTHRLGVAQPELERRGRRAVREDLRADVLAGTRRR